MQHIFNAFHVVARLRFCQVQSREESQVYLSASSTAGHVYVHVCGWPSQEDADTAAELMEQN